MEHQEPEDDFPSNNEIQSSMGSISAEHFEDESVISEDQKQWGDIDNTSPAPARPSPSDGRSTRQTSIEENSSCFVGNLTKCPEVHFVTGSSYEGTWDALGMSGVGRYTTPHGTIYEGEIRDGIFHGLGSLYWSKNQRLDVLHLRGELKENRHTSDDGFILDDENWSYCKFPDRRFHASMNKGGLRPGGRTLKTARQPTKILPYGCYDTGDGIFDPKTQQITSFDDPNKVLRIPSHDEYKWIVDKCRKNWTEPTGYRPELNENWSENPPELPYNLPMSQDSPDNWWRRLTTFTRDFDFLGRRDEKVNDDYADGALSTADKCLCGKSLVVGATCPCMTISTSFEAEEMEYAGKTFASEETSQGYDDLSTVDKLGNTESLSSIDRLKKRYITDAKSTEGRFNVDDDDSSWHSRGESSRSSSFDISSGESWEKRRNRDERASIGPKDSKELRIDEGGRNIDGKRSAMKVFDDTKVNRVVDDMDEGKITEKSVDDMDEQKIAEKSVDDLDERKITEKSVDDMDERKIMEKSVDDMDERKITEKSVEDEDEENIGRLGYEPDARTLEETLREKHYAEDNDKTEGTVEDIFSQKSYVEASQESSGEPADQYLDNGLPIGGFVPSSRESSSAEGEFDYTSESIPREKVSRVRKPETRGNGRGAEGKDNLSEKEAKKEIEKQHDSLISRDSSDPNVVKSNQYMINEYQQEIDIHESNSISMEDLLDINNESNDGNSQNYDNQASSNKALLDRSAESPIETQSQLPSVGKSSKENGILPDEETDKFIDIFAEKSGEASKFTVGEESSSEISFNETTVERKSEKSVEASSVKSEIRIADKDGAEIVQFGGESGLSDKTMASEDQLSKKMSKSTTDENYTRKTPSTKLPSIPEITTKDASSVTSTSMEETSAYVFNGASLENLESCSINSVTESLDKVHPSLVTLVSMKPVLSRETKDRSEVCRKCRRIRKPETEPTNVNVWRISGVNQNYGPKTKIQDLLFHPALTAPRLENVEYTRKRCNNSGLCGTQKPRRSNVPRKSARSGLDKNLNNEK